MWRLTQPARAALVSALASATPPLLRMMFSLQRSGPALSQRGGPSCSLTLEIPLSTATTDELLQVGRQMLTLVPDTLMCCSLPLQVRCRCQIESGRHSI